MSVIYVISLEEDDDTEIQDSLLDARMDQIRPSSPNGSGMSAL